MNKSVNRFSSYMISLLAATTAYMLQASLNVANPIIATIASVFPDLPYTTVVLVATLPTLLAVPGGLIIDKIVDRLGYKVTLIITHLLLVASGLIPGFFYESFGIIAGTVFPKIYGILGRRIYTMCAALTVVGLLFLVLGNNMFMMFVASAFFGLGFYNALSALFVGIGEDVTYACSNL